jgi:hypothetical protein
MERINAEINKWEKSNYKIFWGEIAPCDHSVQIYESDEIFLSLLSNFVIDGLNNSESVIVIATKTHLERVNERLCLEKFDIDQLMSCDQYIPLEASDCISKFLRNDWPDEVLFNRFVISLMSRAAQNGRRVRAFGEMVAVLWAHGLNGATVKLEHLWHKIHQENKFCLLCAYPKSGFTQDARKSIDIICGHHHKVINGSFLSGTEIYYLPTT